MSVLDIDPRVELYFSEPVSARSMTIEFFNEHAAKAAVRGCTHWLTSTNKDEMPWTVSLVFYKPKEI